MSTLAKQRYLWTVRKLAAGQKGADFDASRLHRELDEHWGAMTHAERIEAAAHFGAAPWVTVLSESWLRTIGELEASDVPRPFVARFLLGAAAGTAFEVGLTEDEIRHVVEIAVAEAKKPRASG